ncbi:hypothetical protein ENUP19_0047G0177 [Entamoeba nuttalli]|uniref:Uncharacterized protein n=2 Tax=Entamoeba nuttalli TaxID=412467 RepID=K2GC99_ENTNP|nr:hypothetical protein ENU1_100960 [Entamoeba nuttalli P19]EKE40136.1 hypothetical protein ENU1_100960 [Entamoeba nuttalli P19]|eukprot:XP_008857528.1 hypothetical protein ENU1_100960 [Entamoeba nuttalli P19]
MEEETIQHKEEIWDLVSKYIDEIVTYSIRNELYKFTDNLLEIQLNFYKTQNKLNMSVFVNSLILFLLELSHCGSQTNTSLIPRRACSDFIENKESSQALSQWCDDFIGFFTINSSIQSTLLNYITSLVFLINNFIFHYQNYTDEKVIFELCQAKLQLKILFDKQPSQASIFNQNLKQPTPSLDESTESESPFIIPEKVISILHTNKPYKHNENKEEKKGSEAIDLFEDKEPDNTNTKEVKVLNNPEKIETPKLVNRFSFFSIFKEKESEEDLINEEASLVQLKSRSDKDLKRLSISQRNHFNFNFIKNSRKNLLAETSLRSNGVSPMEIIENKEENDKELHMENESKILSLKKEEKEINKPKELTTSKKGSYQTLQTIINNYKNQKDKKELRKVDQNNKENDEDIEFKVFMKKGRDELEKSKGQIRKSNIGECEVVGESSGIIEIGESQNSQESEVHYVQPIQLKETHATLPLFSVKERDQKGFRIECGSLVNSLIEEKETKSPKTPKSIREPKREKKTQIVKQMPEVIDVDFNGSESDESDDLSLIKKQVQINETIKQKNERYKEIKRIKIYRTLYSLAKFKDGNWLIKRNVTLGEKDIGIYINTSPNKIEIHDLRKSNGEVSQTWNSRIIKDQSLALMNVYSVRDEVYCEREFKEFVINLLENSGFIEIYTLRLDRNLTDSWVFVSPFDRITGHKSHEKIPINNPHLLCVFPVPIILEKDEYYVIYHNYIKRRSTNDYLAIQIRMR